MPADPNRVILTGENPFVRLSQTDGGPKHDECELLAHHHLPGGPGSRSLSDQ